MNVERRRRLAALLLRSYPPSFRDRYGTELKALVDDSPPSTRTLLDLARGASGAWLFPAFIGGVQERRRLRLQATVGTIWAAGVAGVLAVPGLDRLLFDPPPTHPSPSAQRLVDAAQVPLTIAMVLLVGPG
jgi:hypothetical protein